MCDELIGGAERLASEPRPWESPARVADFIRLLQRIESEPGHKKATYEGARAAIARLEAVRVQLAPPWGSSARSF